MECPFIYYYYDVTPKFKTNQYEGFFCGDKLSENPLSETRPQKGVWGMNAGGKFSLGFAKSKSPENSLAKLRPH